MRIATFAIAAVLALAGCEKQDNVREAMDLGDKRVKLSAFPEAVRAYESALDGTPKTAEIHYKLGVLYDDKLKLPLNAIHHYSRFIELVPEGKRTDEAKRAKTDCEKRLNLSLKDGGLMTTAEAARLRNENERLRKDLVEAKTASKAAAQPQALVPGAKDKVPPGARMHTVEKGETLASIAFKYYRNRANSSRIKDANHNQLGGKDNIKPGMILIVPEQKQKK